MNTQDGKQSLKAIYAQLRRGSSSIGKLSRERGRLLSLALGHLEEAAEAVMDICAAHDDAIDGGHLDRMEQVAHLLASIEEAERTCSDCGESIAGGGENEDGDDAEDDENEEDDGESGLLH